MTDRRGFLATLAVLPTACLAPSHAAAMQPGEPSRTARATALQRAAHQLLEQPLVFEDPIALKILGAPHLRWLRANLDRYRGAESRALRALLVARSRHAEDELERACRQGTRQYVVLGAGLDTFAWRNPHADLRVFEVDHPATQAWKRAQLQEHGIAMPPTLSLVPVDFEKDVLADRLDQAGFRRDLPVFVSWLGVTMYLTRDAVIDTLRFVARSCARGSRIVFDYSVPDEDLGARERSARARLAKVVEQIGEPWISHFSTQALARELGEIGFSGTADFDARQANERYFAGRTDGFAVRDPFHMMAART